MTTDVLYVSWNRKHFVEASLPALLENTDWSLVRRLIVHDDGSHDGAWEYARDLIGESSPVPYVLSNRRTRSPVQVMGSYVNGEYIEPADRFAKIDSDIVVPPRWLNDLSQIMDESPELDVLGMSGGFTGVGDPTIPLGWKPAPHIGGVGLIKTSVFDGKRLPPPVGRFGWTGWQTDDQNGAVIGWAQPDIKCFELDLLPFEPWEQLADNYRFHGWGRNPPFPSYDPERTHLWDWWTG